MGCTTCGANATCGDGSLMPECTVPKGLCKVPNSFGPVCCKKTCGHAMGCTQCGTDATCGDGSPMPECSSEHLASKPEGACEVPNKFGPKCCKKKCGGVMGCTTCGANATCGDGSLMPECTA